MVDKEDLDQINLRLRNVTNKFDIVGGYEVLLNGLVDRLPEVYGEATAKNLAYQIGTTPGEKIAKALLQEREGKIYNNPIEAFLDLFLRIRAYYSAEIIQMQDATASRPAKIAVKLSCYFNELYERRPNIPKEGILCRINKGYFERALQIMTNRKVVVNQEYHPEGCKVIFEFK